MNPTVAIILLNWNDYRHTSECLRSLNKLQYKSTKLIVVDNASSDNSLQLLKEEFFDVNFLENNENLGFTGGNNVGIRFALELGCEYMMLLNNDTVVENDFLSKLLHSLMNDPSAGAAQPKILFNENRELIWSAGGIFKPLFSLAPTIGHQEIDKGQFESQEYMDWISCCAFLVKSDVIKEVGLEDEIFFYGCFDDVDLSLRVRDAGYNLLYNPKSVIYHDVMSAVKSEGRKDGNIKPFFHYLVTRNHWFFIRKHTKFIYLPTSFVYQLFKLVAYSSVFILRGRFLKLKAFVHGFFNGIIQPLDPNKLNHLEKIAKYR